MKAKVLSVPLHLQTYHGKVYHVKSAGQTSKTEEKKTLREKENVHQARGKSYDAKKVKYSLKKKKMKRTEELRAFEKMNVSDSDQKSMNSSSSKEGRLRRVL